MQSKCALFFVVLILFVLVFFNPFKRKFRYEGSDRSESQNTKVIVAEDVSYFFLYVDI